MKDVENFPVNVNSDYQRREMKEGLRYYEDLTEKEKRYIIRIFPYTPNIDICKKFGIDQEVLNEVKRWGKDNDLQVEKSETFARTIVPVAQGGKLTKKGKQNRTPGALVSSYMDLVTEEERRQIINMFEEGMEPIPLLEQLIAIQSQRAMRGARHEIKSDYSLQKTANECFADLHSMIKTLHEMQEGQRITHEVGDSFKQLVMSSYRERNEYPREDD
jgi:hypothetical protein